MRIIKENTVDFPSLYNTIVADSKSQKEIKSKTREESGEVNNHEELFNSLYVFGRKIRETNNPDQITEYLLSSLKKFLPIGEIVFYIATDNKTVPVAVNRNVKKNTEELVNTIYHDGVLQRILDEGHLSIIPVREKSAKAGYQYYLVYPIIDIDRSNQYFILINTPERNFESGSFLRKTLQSFIQICTPRMEYLLQRKDLSKTYNELQLYQSKVSSDYKLSAIGEMTYSMIDQIVSPMQVMMSCIDLVEKEHNIDEEILDTLKMQIKKVHSITKRIVKFSNDDKTNETFIPCSMNLYINQFYEFMYSTINTKNYEIILDLEENLPPILSTPNHIQQILTNIFSMMVNTKQTGGLYLKTKYSSSTVVLRVISTDYLDIQTETDKDITKNINLMMLQSLMSKHEGKVNFSSSEERGSYLELSFPLRRKLIK